MHNKSKEKFKQLNRRINNNRRSNLKKIRTPLRILLMLRKEKMLKTIRTIRKREIIRRESLQVNLTKKMKRITQTSQYLEERRIKLKKCKRSMVSKMMKKDN